MDDKRNQFILQVTKLALKQTSYSLLTNEQYGSVLKEYHDAIGKKSKKTIHEYHLLERYSVVNGNETEMLIAKQKNPDEPIRYVVTVEKMYDKLLELHIATGHGGRNRLLNEVQKYAGITREAVMVFLSLCEACQLKRKQAKKGLVVKPIISNAFNSRCQVDLIDMQSQPDGDYRFIMVYQDHLTKFVQLRALKRKTAHAVAEKLYEIFMTFGAPHILQR